MSRIARNEIVHVVRNSAETRQRARLLIADRCGPDHDAIRELFDALALWPGQDDA